MDLSIRDITKEPLGEVLKRGMENEWLGPYRDECIIGEHPEFIQFHNQAVEDWFKKFTSSCSIQSGFGKNKIIK